MRPPTTRAWTTTAGVPSTSSCSCRRSNTSGSSSAPFGNFRRARKPGVSALTRCWRHSRAVRKVEAVRSSRHGQEDDRLSHLLTLADIGIELLNLPLRILGLPLEALSCLRRPVRLVAKIAPSEVQPMMGEIFREVFDRWQVGFIGGVSAFEVCEDEGNFAAFCLFGDWTKVQYTIFRPFVIEGYGPIIPFMTTQTTPAFDELFDGGPPRRLETELRLVKANRPKTVSPAVHCQR